jgi:hypothetical protein
MIVELHSIYQNHIFPRIKGIRGAHFVKRNLQKLAVRNIDKIPKSDREGIWERKWNNLIILDACRYDLFEEVMEDSGFRYSLAS